MEEYGVPVRRIINGGGIPQKNAVLNQVYANVMRKPILVPGGDVTSLGRTYVRTDATIQFIQQFYYARLPNYGWAQQPLLPGQYAMQFATEGSNPTGGAEDELDFARGNGNESVRIVAEGGGYSIILACRD